MSGRFEIRDRERADDNLEASRGEPPGPPPRGGSKGLLLLTLLSALLSALCVAGLVWMALQMEDLKAAQKEQINALQKTLSELPKAPDPRLAVPAELENAPTPVPLEKKAPTPKAVATPSAESPAGSAPQPEPPAASTEAPAAETNEAPALSPVVGEPEKATEKSPPPSDESAVPKAE